MATLTLIGLAAAAAAWYTNRGDATMPEVSYQPPATTLEALGLLARVANWSFSESVKGWRPSDLTIGLLTTSRKEGKVKDELCALTETKDSNGFKSGPAEVGMQKEWLDTLILLLRLMAFSTKLARARKENSITKLCNELGIQAADVLAWRLQSGMLKPAYLLIRDRELEEIVLVVRGTYTFKDTVTCLMGTTLPHHILRDNGAGENDVEVIMGHCHGGMLTAARWLFDQLAKIISSAVEDNPKWGLRVVGHSLGGGTGFLLTTMIRNDPRFRRLDPRCTTFACPACVTADIAVASAEFTTTVIVGEDVVPELCPFTIKSLRLEILQSQWREELKNSFGDSAIFQTAMSISNTATSASTAIYGAARLTSKAVMSASNFTARVGRKLITPMCSSTVRDGLQPSRSGRVLLYRLPSSKSIYSKQLDSLHDKSIQSEEECNIHVKYEEELKSREAHEMVAPVSQSSFQYEELDETSVLTANEEKLESEFCDALNISVSSEDLYSLAEASVSSNEKDVNAKLEKLSLPVFNEKRFDKETESIRDQEKQSDIDINSRASESPDLQQQMKHVNEQLEIVGEMKMYPPGYIMHMVPTGGPNAWTRPDKLAEPGWLQRANTDKPFLKDGRFSYGPKSHSGIQTDSSTTDHSAATPQWALYVGVSNMFYGERLRLSRTMVRDHCQYTYDAAIDQVCNQIERQ